MTADLERQRAALEADSARRRAELDAQLAPLREQVARGAARMGAEEARRTAMGDRTPETPEEWRLACALHLGMEGERLLPPPEGRPMLTWEELERLLSTASEYRQELADYHRQGME